MEFGHQAEKIMKNHAYQDGNKRTGEESSSQIR